MAGLIGELRRRNVFRVAGLYLMVGWLLLQAANLLEGALQLPGWFDGVVTAFVILGFPIALILAWAFEMTPEGVKRTTPEDEADDAPAPRSRPLDFVLVAALLITAGLIVADRWTADGAGGAAGSPAGGASIAVLPFLDLSPGRDQAYFSDGLSEEILNVLARDSNLPVAGRTSSFAFRGKEVDLRQIAKTLGVTHVLEGSVRKSGPRVRVTAQLIRADTGFHVFSESYDRELAEVFAVQDDIARRIAHELRARLEKTDRPRRIDIEPYERFLAARDAVHTRDKAQLERAEGLVDRVIAEAPDFAPAHALKATITILLSDAPGTYGDRPASQEIPKAKTQAGRALALDPDLAEAHAVIGLALTSTPEDDGDPVPHLERALELDPNDSNAQLWLFNAQPKTTAAFARLARLAERDPGFLPAVVVLVNHHLLRAEIPEARALVERAAAVPGMAERLGAVEADIAYAQYDLVRAYRLAKREHERRPDSPGARVALAAILVDLGAFEQAFALGGPKQKFEVLLARGDLEGAVELAERHEPHADLIPLVLGTYVRAADSARAVAVYEARFGSVLDREISGQLEWLDLVLPLVARAYADVGRTREAARATALAERSLEALGRLGYQHSVPGRVFEAELEVLRGHPERAVAVLDAMLDEGMATANTGTFFAADRLPAADMRRIEARFWDRTDRARAELGWAPMKRPAR